MGPFVVSKLGNEIFKVFVKGSNLFITGAFDGVGGVPV